MTVTQILPSVAGSMDEIFKWSFAKMAEDSRAAGAVPVVYLPVTQSPPPVTLLRATLDCSTSAAQAGLVTIDPRTVGEGWDRDQIQVAAWHGHPNALGHRLIVKEFTAR